MNTITTEFVGSHLVISSKKDSAEYLNDLAVAIESVRNKLNENDMIILGVQNTPWLYQKNDYAPVKKSIKYLEAK